MFLTRTSCYKTTSANSYYSAWPGWAVSINVLPLTTLVIWQYLVLFSIFISFMLEMYLFTVIQCFLNLCTYENFHRDFFKLVIFLRLHTKSIKSQSSGLRLKNPYFCCCSSLVVPLLLAGHRVFGKFYHNVCFYSKAFMYSVSPSVRSNSFVAPWTVACQAPLTMGFPRQEYWNG